MKWHDVYVHGDDGRYIESYVIREASGCLARRAALRLEMSKHPGEDITAVSKPLKTKRVTHLG